MRELRRTTRRVTEALERRQHAVLDEVEAALDSEKASPGEEDALIAGLAAMHGADQERAMAKLRKTAAEIVSRRRPWKPRVRKRRPVEDAVVMQQANDVPPPADATSSSPDLPDNVVPIHTTESWLARPARAQLSGREWLSERSRRERVDDLQNKIF